jgi:hypothetical protein
MTYHSLWICFRFLFVPVCTPVLRKSASRPRQKKFPFRHFIGHAILDPFERHQGATPMEWTTPKHEEVDLNCEISSYANAEL